ncbi:MAG: glycoside hydrolase family 57 protein [Polyangiales bacterium]
MRGYLGIVLHAHLPFVRHPEHARHLEERWLFEAILECYLPLIGMLDRLGAEGVPVALTTSLTPTLADMLQDDLLRARFEAHLARLQSLQRKELRRAGDHPRFGKAIHFYGGWLAEVRATWERHGGDLVGALVSHVRAGRLDLLASAATHAFLPGLLPDPPALRAQIKIGMDAFRNQTGLKPCGFWLPECAYDPAFDQVLAEEGVRFSVLEEHGLTYARPRPPMGTYAPIASPSGVAFFARDLSSGRQVWSRDEGYPGDPWYREFYRDIGFDLPEHDLLGEIGPFGARVSTGLKYHRVTGPGLDLADKAPWDPDMAKERAWAHAGHFVDSRRQQLAAVSSALGGEGPTPIVTSPYDAELFGHWWFEGPWFLEAMFRRLASEGQGLAAITLRRYLNEQPELAQATPAPSTWGARGHAGVWIDQPNAWLWRHVHHASRDVEARLARELAAQLGGNGERGAAEQAVAELLLLQASDWPFIVEMATARQYAESRARAHAARLRELLGMLERHEIDTRRLADLCSRDDFLASVRERMVDAFNARA